MRVRINLQIFIIAIIFYFTKQIQIYSIIMLFTLIHEIGHMVAGVFTGLKPRSLEIQPFGVSINFEGYSEKTNKEKKKLFIALAGPITNFIIAVITPILIKNIDYQLKIIYANLIIGFFNLIPIYPLDGGRILRSILSIITKTKQAEYLTNKITKIIMVILTATCSIVILYIQNIWIFLIIIYLWLIVLKEDKHYKYKIRMCEIIEKNKIETLENVK